MEGSHKGQDSILCEGECQGCMHKVCAGICKNAFQKANVSDEPFYCHYCKSSRQEAEISNLKSTINNLESELAQLKTMEYQAHLNRAVKTIPTTNLALPVLYNQANPSAPIHTLFALPSVLITTQNANST